LHCDYCFYGDVQNKLRLQSGLKTTEAILILKLHIGYGFMEKMT